MNYQLFGSKTGLWVSELALGTGMFGTATGYGAEPAEARRIWDGYAEAGGNFIDTSNAYQLGEAERLVGEFLGSNRGGFVLLSKYTRGTTAAPALAQLGNHRKAMTQAVEASLKRLRTDYLDFYFAHLPDGVTPAEEIVRSFDELVRAGKILYGGLSNFPAWRVATAATAADLRGWAPLAGIQVEYNLVQRTTERELLPMAEGLGLGVMGYSPLGGGVLTGKYRRGEAGRATASAGGPPASGAQTGAVLDALVAVADELAASPGQVATAWVKAKGVVPIAGPRTRAQLDDYLGAAALVLSPASASAWTMPRPCRWATHTSCWPPSATHSPATAPARWPGPPARWPKASGPICRAPAAALPRYGHRGRRKHAVQPLLVRFAPLPQHGDYRQQGFAKFGEAVLYLWRQLRKHGFGHQFVGFELVQLHVDDPAGGPGHFLLQLPRAAGALGNMVEEAGLPLAAQHFLAQVHPARQIEGDFTFVHATDC